MVWLPTGKPARNGLEVGSKGILPLCPISPIPKRSSTPQEPDQDGLATNWSPRRKHQPICPRAMHPKPARNGLVSKADCDPRGLTGRLEMMANALV
jgi:hypothetical protein